MNRRISVLIVSIVFLGVALITVIPIALGPSLAPTKKDTTSSKDPSDRPANTTTSVREADERNLPVPFNYYAQNPDPDATFTSFGGIDDIGDWSYPGSPTPHKLEIGAAGGFQYPTKQDPDDPNETNYTSYDNKRRVPGEFALQLAQPDSYLVGGAPVGGLTYGWGLPDNYVSGASRTILLNWSQHDHGAYFDFDPFRQALISNPAAYKPEPYALDLTVNNTPEDFVPVYSTIDGSVIEYMGATPAGPAVENCPSGNCHGYGNFVRIRNSRWAAVNATAMYVDNNPTLCRDGAPGRVAGYTYVTSPSTVDPNKCVTGLLTDDKCEVTCTTLDTTGAVVGVPETTTNQLYKEARKSCMVDVEAGQFRNSDPSLPNGGVGSYLDTYAVKVTNYEIVLGYLTNGSVDKFFNPDGSDQSKAITNQGQVGTLGHSGFYWDTATSQYLPNTDRPMLHSVSYTHLTLPTNREV